MDRDSTIKLLIRSGAAVEGVIDSSTGDTPIEVTAWASQIGPFRILIEAGAKLTTRALDILMGPFGNTKVEQRNTPLGLDLKSYDDDDDIEILSYIIQFIDSEDILADAKDLFL